MSIVVDFPAPFGPSSATVSPGEIVMSTPRTALTGPAGERKDFVNPARWIPVEAAEVRSVRSVVTTDSLPEPHEQT